MMFRKTNSLTRSLKPVLLSLFLLGSLTDRVLAEIPFQNQGLMSAAGLTDDFRSWLQLNGYERFNFSRNDLGWQGSFGGRFYKEQPVRREPIIFIHGNSDRALGDGKLGWDTQMSYYLEAGYTNAELYATTWGPADAEQAGDQRHSGRYLIRLRAFIEAVLDYTEAEKVDVIAHSMGVTLARKVILGGGGVDEETGPYNLGSALTNRVDTFVGIAGANLGLASCALAERIETCNDNDGFYPGGLYWGFPRARSDFLSDLNHQPGREGSYVVSIWSPNDEIIGYGNRVYGRVTGRIPNQDDEVVIRGSDGDHFDLKNKTADEILPLLSEH